MERLNKYLSEAGICSRREADRFIEDGRVCVNGKTAETGMKVSDSDTITVDGKEVAGKEKKVVLAYYKPVGVVCTEKDRHAQVTIRDVFDYPVRVTYAGRLDKDSEGLLLMTNDGDLINNLMRAANFHEKEYLVRVNKPISREFLKKMSEGVLLKELKVKTRPCFVKEEGKFLFRIILTQGINRQLRRMCRELGYDVVNIRRVRVANILLGEMKPGEVRPIAGTERKELYENVEKNMQRGNAGRSRQEKKAEKQAELSWKSGTVPHARADAASVYPGKERQEYKPRNGYRKKPVAGQKGRMGRHE